MSKVMPVSPNKCQVWLYSHTDNQTFEVSAEDAERSEILRAMLADIAPAVTSPDTPLPVWISAEDIRMVFAIAAEAEARKENEDTAEVEHLDAAWQLDDARFMKLRHAAYYLDVIPAAGALDDRLFEIVEWYGEPAGGLARALKGGKLGECSAALAVFGDVAEMLAEIEDLDVTETTVLFLLTGLLKGPAPGV